MDTHPPSPPSTLSPPYAPSRSPDSDRDVQHLNLLGIFYYVYGGLTALGGCGSIIYIIMGIVFAAGGIETEPGDPPAEVLGGIFTVVGACMMIFLFGFAALYIATGYYLQNQRHRVFCMVMAAISCLSIPLGTILGVFTLVVLSRPSVADLFERRRDVM